MNSCLLVPPSLCCIQGERGRSVTLYLRMNAGPLVLPSLCSIQWKQKQVSYIVPTARRRMNAGPLVLPSVVFSQKP